MDFEKIDFENKKPSEIFSDGFFICHTFAVSRP